MLGTLTTSLLPVRPFDNALKSQTVTREVEEFVPEEGGQFAFPFTTYINHLYIHPRSLKYDGQKAFAKVCCFPYFNSLVLFAGLLLEFDLLRNPFLSCDTGEQLINS